MAKLSMRRRRGAEGRKVFAMTETSVVERLKAGEEVDIAEIEARVNELEIQFDDRGFVYIAVNDWLISSLEGDPVARELMFLRSVHDGMDGLSVGKVIVAEESDIGTFVSRPKGRYAPEGCIYLIPCPSAKP